MIKDAMAMPACQVTCERSCSKLKLIENYLHIYMLDTRLSDLMLLAIESDLSSVINYS